MWACMIALPVFALLGSGWTRYLDWGSQPEEISHRGSPARSGRTSAAPQTGLSQMMHGQPQGAAGPRAPEPAAADPLPQPSRFSPAAARQLKVGAAPRSDMPFGGPPAQLAASFDAPSDTAADQQRVVRASGGDEQPMELPRPLPPANLGPRSGRETTGQPTRLGNERSIQRLPPPSAPDRSPDWFSAVAQRLRDLGATYYLLETWGRNGELYRFHCKMAVAGSQSYTRHFEATSDDAAQAMRSVLEQVEAWRSGRSR